MNFFLTYLLDAASSGSGSGSGAAANSGNGWMNWIIIGVMVVAIIVMFVMSSRSNKKRQQEQEATMNAVRPGNKVKTIGGVCGIVVEVNDEENTFVMETGNELNGKCYLKFDKQAIYQTDAKVEKTDEKDKDAKDSKEEKAEEKVAETETAEQSKNKEEK